MESLSSVSTSIVLPPQTPFHHHHNHRRRRIHLRSSSVSASCLHPDHLRRRLYLRSSFLTPISNPRLKTGSPPNPPTHQPPTTTMAKTAFMLALCVLLPAVITAARLMSRLFRLQGKVYCDNCRAGFLTSATTYIPRAKVRVECKDKEQKVLYTMEGTTDSTGTYHILVNVTDIDLLGVDDDELLLIQD